MKDLNVIWQNALDAIDSALYAHCAVRLKDIDTPDDVLHPFHGIETDYKRHIFFQDYYNLLVIYDCQKC